MFNYLVLNAYAKPFQYCAQLIKEKSNKNEYLIIQQAKRDELKIYDLFKNKEKTTIGLIVYGKDADLYSIEKLKLFGHKIDKILVEEINIYNLRKYDYIITNNHKTSASYIKHTNNKTCSYNNDVLVECLIPFEHIINNGFNEIKPLELNNYKILEKNLLH